MRRNPLRSVTMFMLGIAGLLPNMPAHAQTVDYGSLETLFGEPITTSATGTPQRASDVPANMTIITADEIRQSGSHNIPDILSRVPGLDILRTGENAYSVGIRGFQEPFQPRLLILVDGRQVFLDDYSRTIWDNIPVNINDIRQIEIVKGASSALFGSNASGGVINIITYSPTFDKNNIISASGGTQESLNGDATVTTKLGGIAGLKLSAGGMNAHEFNTANNATDLQSFSPMKRYIVGSTVVDLTPNLHANGEVTYSHDRSNPANMNFYTDAEDMTSYSIRGGLAWQSPFGVISNNNYINHSFAHALGTSFESHYTTQLIVSQLQDQFKIGADHAFQAAIEYRHKSHENVSTNQAFVQSPAFEQDVYAVSGTWNWQISNQLSWTNALRLDHQDMAQTGSLFADAFITNSAYSHVINTWSANSGLVYKPTDKDTLRVTYGRGVQLPSFFNEGLVTTVALGGSTFYDLEGNPQLKPTVVENYELGYDRAVPELYSTARVALYYEISHDIVGFASGSFVRVVGPNTYITIQSVNVGNSDGFGGEFQFKGNHNGFRWDGSYSFARVVDEPGVSSVVGYDGSAPKHHFRLLGGYTTGPWEMDVQGQYLTSTHMKRAVDASTYPQTFAEGYASLGGRVAYNINDHVTVAVSGANITNGTTKESPYPAVERQIFLTFTGKF